MLHMPSPMLLSKDVQKTYNEWQARLLPLPAYSWTNNVYTPSAQSFRTTCGGSTGSMGGSPWISRVATSTVARIVQHCFPTQQAFVAAQSAGDMVWIILPDTTGAPAVEGLTRNGYTSAAVPAGTESGVVTAFRYYDRSLGQPMEVNPSTGAGPFPYSW